MNKGSLRNVVRRFVNGENNAYTDGLWKIAKGGYDLWFEVYYNNIAVVQCVDGELTVVNSNDIDKFKTIEIIKQEYKGLKSN